MPIQKDIIKKQHETSIMVMRVFVPVCWIRSRTFHTRIEPFVRPRMTSDFDVFIDAADILAPKTTVDVISGTFKR